MILAFHRVIKPGHHVYMHREIDDVFEDLSQPEPSRSAIPQISRDTGIPRQTLKDWHNQRSQKGGQNWPHWRKGIQVLDLSATRMKPESPTSLE
jgi:hypothetical protein